MAALKAQEQEKRESKFTMQYEKWKQRAKNIRTKLKEPCGEEELTDMMESLEQGESQVVQIFNNLREHGAPPQPIKRKMDTFTAVTADIMNLLHHRMAEGDDDDWDYAAERARLHVILDKDYAKSVYSTVSVISNPPGMPPTEYSSPIERASAKLAESEAELQIMEEEDRLLQGIEEQKCQLKRLQKEKDVRVAKAIISALNPETASFKPKETKTPVSHLQSSANQHGNSTSDQTSLVQALQASLVLGRLPLPEPSVFDGNPLSYTEWKASFLTLVGSRPITPQEKFFDLKKYAGVEASKVIQGFFLNHTEESYNSAWTALESRYGNPFMLQRAYRDKLTNWPTIGARDSEALREYSGFLQSCQATMEHVPGLNTLHDCIENQKMVVKLPYWAADSWNRKVTKSIELGQYPDFHTFVGFVVGEANVACNPITSSLALSENKPKKEGKGPREPKRKAVNTSHNRQAPRKQGPRADKDMPIL